MPKKETRYTEDGRRVLRQGEYWREDRQTYQYKAWDQQKRRFVTCSAKTLPELREKEKQVQKDIIDGISATNGKDTLDAYCELWLKNKRIKKNVLMNYRYMYDRFVRPILGGRKLKDIKYSTVQSFYLDLLDNGNVQINTLEVIHNVIHGILDQAVRDDVVRRNVSDGILADLKKRYPQPKKRKALTLAEQERLIEVLNMDENILWKPLILVLLRTGLRIGEATGLVWSDIDYDAGVIHVQRTLVYYSNHDKGQCEFTINSTKTVTSTRDLPLTDELKELF